MTTPTSPRSLLTSTAFRVVGFLAALAAAFGLALGVGGAVGPVGAEPTTHGEDHEDGSAADEAGADHSVGHEEATAQDAEPEIPGGLMISQDGYTFRLAEPTARPGAEVPVRFVIEGPDGRPVTDYEVEHDKQLHLIAVRRDLAGFQHVHPTLDADGVWSTDLDLIAGQWRLFADFTATGVDGMTLGADLSVAGDYQPQPEPGEVRTARVDDYTVTLEGDLTAGADAQLTLSVARDGEPVTDLQPYLGAYGHLVALREGDLAYLHVHPDGTPGDGSTRPGPGVVFYAAVPSDGGYRLFLDFKHDGIVRTAAFAVSAGGARGAAPDADPPAPHDQTTEEGDDGHDH